jgi:ATP-binding cassette subfamily B protein
MSLFRLYTRVLQLLGTEARLGWILAGANLLLAGAQFAEPVLFGKIVDVLSGKPAEGPLASSSAWPLLAAWAAFGLFTILCGAAVALNADKLAHRQRQAVLTGYFEHIMQLPLTFHTGTHSGRLMKVMLNGTDSSASTLPRSCRWSCYCRWRSTSTGGSPSCCSSCAWCSPC